MPNQPSKSRADQLKLGLAIAGLLIAGLLIAWNYGAFDSLFRPKVTDPMAGYTPQEKADIKRQQKQAEEQAKITPPS